MRGLVNSAMATLFVLVLLLVIPIVAVVGIPEFVPVVASSSQALEGTEHRVPIDEGVGESAVQQPRDLFAGFDDGRPSEQLASNFDVSHLPARSRDVSERLPRDGRSLTGWDVDERGRVTRARARVPEATNAFASNEATLGASVAIDGPGRAETSSRAGRHSPDPVRTDVSTSEPLTWKAAIARLNDLGIREYSLDPGREGRDFHFACDFAVNGDVRHARRFEAEAAEPLRAVERVLDQIDDWLAHRR